MSCATCLVRLRFTTVVSSCRQSIRRIDSLNASFLSNNIKQSTRNFTWSRPQRTSPSRTSEHPGRSWSQRRVLLGIALGATTTGATFSFISQKKSVWAEEPSDDIRHIRIDEIGKHGRDAETHWVYRGNRVYDITDFIEGHPGGEVINRALGGSVDAYWDIFSIHQKQDVYDILEEYFIGEIDPRDLIDGKPPTDKVEDPFVSDPSRNPDLVVHNDRPFNAETATSDLQSFVTATESFFTRNHLWVPEVNEKEYRLTVELPDGTEAAYSVDDLRKRFKDHTITASLQCSGNRRSHMNAGSSEETSGIPWDVGAISNAEWTGIRMVDILQDAGFDIADDANLEDVRHVQFTGAEAYGASVPIEKVLDRFGDVLIVHSMNGKPLPRDHGYPLRALVPGTVAARSVKWLTKISLSDEESTSQWQRRDYKCFGPNEGRHPDWDRAVAIQELPVQSAITSAQKLKRKPQELEGESQSETESPEGKSNDKGKTDNKKSSDNEEHLLIHGYAVSGGGRRIVRVDISPDDGKTWQQAEFGPAEEKGQKSWSWRRWSHAVPVKSLEGHICVKATDDAYNTQPETFPAYWNHRGNLANSWHRVSVADFVGGKKEGSKSG